MNILKKGHKILYDRSEEKERQYGPMQDGIKRASMIASGALGRDVTPKEIYIMLIALKLSRESYNHKEDNLLDLVAYVSSLNDYENEKL